MLRLFGQVERRMREIDRLLVRRERRPRAGQDRGERHRQAASSAAASRASKCWSDIDKILELRHAARAGAAAPQQSNNGGKVGQQGKQGQSPLDQQRGDSPSGARSARRKASPRRARAARSPRASSSNPKARSRRDPRRTTATRTTALPTVRPSCPPSRCPLAAGNDRWGDLPVHVRELFRAQGGGDLPPRYRDWIDSYYRRSNQRP
jgi:hypothetical protein